MIPKTMDFKIIGTIGPSSIDLKTLLDLKANKMSHFRINLSHASYGSLETYFKRFEEANIAPSLDTQGAQVRVGNFVKPRKLELYEDLELVHESVKPSSSNSLQISCRELFDSTEVGDVLKIGFSGLICSVDSVKAEELRCKLKVINPGVLEPNKAIDISGKKLDLPPFTEFDINSIRIGLTKGIESIFVSFCDSRKTIDQLNAIISQCLPEESPKPLIIAKIESVRGVINLPDIVKAADGILIDRGDLSREIRISGIPNAVASIVDTCKKNDCPCYIATNVLDSMIEDELPSRAEISDIYNLLVLGVSGFVLAAEVAIGKHPVESVQVVNLMHQIHELNSRHLGSEINLKELTANMPVQLAEWL